MKSLDRKLANLRAGRYTPNDFIIADAKDADMAYGLMAPGPARRGQDAAAGSSIGTRADYLNAMREMTKSGLVDIMLSSVSTAEILSNEGLYRATEVTPAVRYNDTTDIWYPRGALYGKLPSQPFRTARLEKLRAFADLGLYSVTFSNDVDRDLASLRAYADFRAEAAALGLRHFLEVFNPAFDVGIAPHEIGNFVADCIVRCLAGVDSSEQPIFLKIMYNGRRSMEALAQYDPTRLIVGILGGAKGTTRDTFELLARAEAAGARVALFGRKINYAEDPITLVQLMRKVIAGSVTSEQAVRAYHEQLASRGIKSLKPLAEDIQISDPVLLADN